MGASLLFISPMTEPIERTLGRLEEKVDRVLDVLALQEPRIAALETWRVKSTAYLAGGTAVLSVLFLTLFKVLSLLS